MRSTRQTSGRRRMWCGVRIGGFAALLLLLVAVPAALAIVGPTSTSSYSNFATNGNSGDNHWSNTTQIVPIVVVPSVSTTGTAWFSSDNGANYDSRTANRTGTVSFDFSVAAEGSNAIKYYASDSSNATETPANGPFFVNIDKTTPITTSTGLAPVSSQSLEAAWSKDVTRTVTFAATDPLPSPGIAISGVKEILRSINGGPSVSSATTVTFTMAKGSGGVVEGANAVAYSARDWAGNVETTHTGYINIDTVAPVTSPTPALASSATSGWRNTAATITLNWTDVSSGVPTGGTSYRLNDGNLTVYGAPFTVSTEGSTKLTYRSIDRALNAEATQTAYVNIDQTPPTVSAATAPTHSSGWYNKDVVVTLAGADALSGVAKTQYRLQGATVWTDAVGNQFTVPVSPSAELTYDYQAVDNAGNVSVPASLKLKMDSVKPHTYGQNASGKVHKSITLKYKITDNLSPKAKSVAVKIKDSKGHVVKNLSFSAQKNVKTWYSFTWKPTKKGTYKYYVYAKDLAGNPQNKAGWAKITVK
jgi:hypothetical protein